MNRTTRASLTLAVLAIAALASLGAATTASASATPPTVEREWVTGVTEQNAVLHAEINPNGSLTKYKLQFDESGTFHFYQADCGVLHVPGYAYCQHVVPGDERVEPPEGSIPAGNSPVEVSVDLAGIGATIEPNRTYYYRAIAANGVPEVEGPTQTFTTESPPPGPPTIDSESVSNITATDATLEAQINSNGLETSYKFRVEYGCFSSRSACQWVHEENLPSRKIPPSTEGQQSVSLNLNEAGVTLKPGWEYRYSVEATNSSGTAQGSTQYFTTSSSSPSIESESAANITATDATMEAKIDPGGLETEYQFRVIGDPCRAKPVNCLLPAGSGPDYPSPPARTAAASGGQVVKLDLNSAGLILKPGKEYHYAVFATNPQGTVSGPEQSFTTAPTNAPLIESESVSNITPTDATLEAQINTEGLETTYTLYLHEEGPPCLKADPPCMVLEKAPIPLPSGKLLGSFVGQNVSADLNSAGVNLTPGRSYEYWATATNAAGTTEGQPQHFTTPSEPTAEPLTEPSGTDLQSLMTTQSPPSNSPSQHQKHKRRHHRAKLHRAKRAG